MTRKGTNFRPSILLDNVRCYRCGRCGEWKPPGQFHRWSNPASACGIGSWCKRCNNAARTERRRKAKAAKGAAAAAAVKFAELAVGDGFRLSPECVAVFTKLSDTLACGRDDGDPLNIGPHVEVVRHETVFTN